MTGSIKDLPAAGIRYIASLGRGMDKEIVGALSAVGMGDEAMAWAIAQNTLDQLVAEGNTAMPESQDFAEFLAFERPNEAQIREQNAHVEQLWVPISTVINEAREIVAAAGIDNAVC